jgi:hypothetical protein
MDGAHSLSDSSERSVNTIEVNAGEHGGNRMSGMSGSQRDLTKLDDTQAGAYTRSLFSST